MGIDTPPRSLVPGQYPSEASARRARARLARRLKPVLDELVASRDQTRDISHDPIRFVHQYDDPRDQEVVGLVASSLAYGGVTVILRSVARVLEVLGPRPARALTTIRKAVLEEKLASFVHRWTRGPEIVSLLSGVARAVEEHGSLGRCFEGALEQHGMLRLAVRDFSRAIIGPDPSRGVAYLLPDGTGASACKRLHLYLRWMIRPADGVDLGLWDVSPSVLLMPLDTHTSRLCHSIGLTHRIDASWRTAEEVTWGLRGLDPDDPVKYDFALSHLGISRDCRHQRDDELCDECVLKAVCAG